MDRPKYHWVPDKPDSRDYRYRAVIPKADIPSSVDLRRYASPIEDQGNLGSCTGQAIAGCIELLHRKQNKNYDISRLFIYYQERVILGTINYDSGAYIRDGIKVCYTNGAPLESYWPYNINKFAVKPMNAAYIDAEKRKITRYERCLSLSSVKAAIAAGNAVVFGFLVYSSFESSVVSRTGMMPYPNISRERLLGGHAVCAVGYRDSDQRLICRNSWGSSWGDRGYFYMPYQVVNNTSMSSDFWVISSVNIV